MPLTLVQSTNALLEGEQRLVDLCSIDLGLLILVDVVGPSLISCQVNEADLGEDFLLMAKGNL